MIYYADDNRVQNDLFQNKKSRGIINKFVTDASCF